MWLTVTVNICDREKRVISSDVYRIAEEQTFHVLKSMVLHQNKELLSEIGVEYQYNFALFPDDYNSLKIQTAKLISDDERIYENEELVYYLYPIIGFSDQIGRLSIADSMRKKPRTVLFGTVDRFIIFDTNVIRNYIDQRLSIDPEPMTKLIYGLTVRKELSKQQLSVDDIMFCYCKSNNLSYERVVIIISELYDCFLRGKTFSCYKPGGFKENVKFILSYDDVMNSDFTGDSLKEYYSIINDVSIYLEALNFVRNTRVSYPTQHYRLLTMGTIVKELLKNIHFRKSIRNFGICSLEDIECLEISEIELK